ncbi:M20/M25/M40 family metallo-hydrolase [Paracrocinitomix mangrovi]|uniref:M20/M25/M40 family metallo-hydrolase n=1 Tax=Paracrocinitomix mangrovi TaxID=2862509 RepID=UPI001C8D2F9B|nr:M20/M25/M40 family metallo-hydrolase [Paracrocinitomix mangrovi]UKN03104.1 M20/M25/M40 family metallo-hydrolase [Paracrocinitomix mangrovi]
MKSLTLTAALFLGVSVFGHEGTPNPDSVFIRKIYDEALEKGQAYDNLRTLCKDIGARVTGSSEAEMAVKWGEKLLKSYQFDEVYLQEIEVPHWERGTKETCWIENESGEVKKLSVLALGGSVGTGGLIEGEVVVFNSLEELKAADKALVKNKIVFLNRPFDQKLLQMFKAYGACANQRHSGPNEGGKLGAKAVVIRSLASSTDEHAHTGSTHYDADVDSIPGAAISTVDADVLSAWLQKGKVTLKLEMDCRIYPNVKSHNVIAEMKGNKDNKIITFGGHLDSWDVGEGAHDDGAGIVHSIEALRILKQLGYKPNHTLRCVLFMNEENGNFGGKSYAKIAHDKGEEHICALESDRGGFLPIGFDIQGTDEQVSIVQTYASMLKGFELYNFQKGYSGVDIRPLTEYYPEMIQLGMSISSQRYFDYHHSEADVFENVNKRELHLGAGAFAALIYLMDKTI